MQISVETIGPLEKSMRVEVPEEKIAIEVDNRLKSLMRTAKIQGFRPGKVPLKVVEKRFGSKVRQEVIGEVMQSSFYDAISQEKLRLAGNPEIGSFDAEQGAGLSYTAKFEVLPEIELSAPEKLEIEKPVCQITDTDVDNMIDLLRQQRQTLKEVERKATSNDVVDIDFKGTVNGESFEGGEAKNFKVVLSEKRLIDGFEEGLIGKQAGDKISLNLNFPEEYQVEELAGKPVNFEVTVNNVQETELPELNDAFFNEFGVKEGGKEAFRKQIQDHMEREAEQGIKNRLRNSVMDALHEANELELPTVLVDREKQQIKQRLEENLKAQGIKMSKEGADDDDGALYENQARKRVALQLIVAELISQYDLKADSAKVKAVIEKIAENYQEPATIVNWYYSDKNRLAEIEASVLEDEVVNWVSERAKLTEVNVTFDECVNNRQTKST